jgi:hypothetical protein
LFFFSFFHFCNYIDDGTDYHTSPHIAITSNGSIIFVDGILNANNSSSNKNESIASSNNHEGSIGKQNDTIPSQKAVTTPESFTCGNSGGGGGGGGGYDNSTTDQVDDSFSLYKYSPTNSLALLEGGNTNGNEADVDESIITTTPYYLSSSSSSPGVCNDGSINTSSFINDNSIDNGMIMTPISTCVTTPGGMFDDGNDNRGISSTDAIFGSRSKINTSGFSTIVVAGFGSRGKGNDSSGNINGVDEEEIPDDTSSGTCNTRVTASSIISGTWKGTGGINVDIIMSTASQAYDFVNNDECIQADIDDNSIGDDDDDDDDKVSNDTNYESDGSNNDSVNAPRQLLF